MSRLNLYAIFHLNLAFSSIEVEQRSEVVDRCYWPLLRLTESQGLTFGIEASGYTLEEIARLDPAWIAELKRLCHQGTAELVGSGYAQMIGPLVPATVNRWNQTLGLEVYERLLDVRPALALVNEQAYSAGLVEHYLAAGYQGIVMDWENPSFQRKDWCSEWRYLPQRAKGTKGDSIPLLWNMSLPFQQFQRYVHGEQELDSYLSFLGKRCGDEERLFSLYGNDAEIFDYRPGRFKTESRKNEGEWERMAKLFSRLKCDDRFHFISPSEALSFGDRQGAGQVLELQTACQPVPVKKQGKYNINRWAVTGRDDLFINSSCHRICQHLEQNGGVAEQWRELCYLWSSDFRTHITEKRWDAYLRRLHQFLAQCPDKGNEHFSVKKVLADADSRFRVECQNRILEINTNALRLTLNLGRGLAIDELALSSDPGRSLVGTLAHGYFDQIDLGADFYSGHLVAEIPGDHKLTDLQSVTPEIEYCEDALVVSATIPTPLGVLKKRLIVPSSDPEIILQYGFAWSKMPLAALRLGHVTLNPEAFKVSELFYRTHNGGVCAETFWLAGVPVNHLTASGFLVSSSQGVGMTSGMIEMGDSQRRVRVEFDPGVTALSGHVQFQPVDGSYFYRTVFSAREIDDTCSACRQIFSSVPQKISLKIKLLAG